MLDGGDPVDSVGLTMMDIFDQEPSKQAKVEVCSKSRCFFACCSSVLHSQRAKHRGERGITRKPLEEPNFARSRENSFSKIPSSSG